MNAAAMACTSRGVCGGGVGADKEGVGAGAVCWGNGTRGIARDGDRDTEMHRVPKVMAIVDYGGAMGRTKGHAVQVVPLQVTATGAADQGVTHLV